jgi:hypothetical protein
MGERRLKDLIRAERVYQLVVPGLPADFPPPKTLDARAQNLPVQATSFVGRERECNRGRPGSARWTFAPRSPRCAVSGRGPRDSSAQSKRRRPKADTIAIPPTTLFSRS